MKILAGSVISSSESAAKIQALVPEEHELTKALSVLNKRVKTLSTFDHAHFERLKKTWHEWSAETRKLVEKEAHIEWKKIRAEEQLVTLHQATLQYNHHFQHAVRMMIASLKTNRSKEALSWTDEAIRWEKYAQQTLGKIRKLENKLQRYIDRDI